VDPGLISRIKATGARVGVQVGNPEGGRLAEAAGADFLIAQGVEAGWHVQSTMPLANLIEGLREMIRDIPIVVAGRAVHE
jgi:nitronate monooxygenase